MGTYLCDGKDYSLKKKPTTVTRVQILPAQALCRPNEIPDGEARGFTLEVGTSSREVFIVRKGEKTFGYINSCPHARWPLEFIEDQFMTLDKRHIQCVNHGAWFEIETGRCLGGPCRGQSLDPFPVELHDGWIVPRR